MTPTLRLLIASIGAIFLIKAAILIFRRGPYSPTGLALFLFAWPGVIPHHFQTPQTPQPIDPISFLNAWARMALGALSVILLAVYAPQLPNHFLGLAGTAAILLTIHLGICDLLPWLHRWAGFSVPPLFIRPWAATSLADFWGRRWNLAFVEMNQTIFLRPLYRTFGRRRARFALFSISGLLHELGLSWTAGAGWGLPLACFLLHGILVELEQHFKIANRVWTWFWLATTFPWIFHEPFRRTLIVPFYYWLHAIVIQCPWDWYLSQALYAAALGHLVVLIASFQAPARLGWRQDIPKLTPFNQKVFWVYASYVLLCIVSFAILTWRLHDSFLTGEPAARGLASFIAIFWTLRVLADLVYYDHRDWPQGNALLVGHALVTSLFCSLAAVYWFAAFAPLVSSTAR